MKFKTIDEVIDYLKGFKSPYAALEGSRNITPDASKKMEDIARRLVTSIPNLIVRSGMQKGLTLHGQRVSILLPRKGLNYLFPRIKCQRGISFQETGL
ncbi:MAG: hypothetical protein A2Z59_07780 [Nitrospinae bacterium RIFCSPLOWO2_02_39_17]|nr:MAG: hypothetical protein A2Z59_07780 [Nitrospinae bacterium RIFCSPLOWO2_02_39_17]